MRSEVPYLHICSEIVCNNNRNLCKWHCWGYIKVLVVSVRNRKRTKENIQKCRTGCISPVKWIILISKNENVMYCAVLNLTFSFRLRQHLVGINPDNVLQFREVKVQLWLFSFASYFWLLFLLFCLSCVTSCHLTIWDTSCEKQVMGVILSAHFQ